MRSFGTIRQFPEARPTRLDHSMKIPTIEDTGRGDDLCFDYYFARFFYDDSEAVKECCGRFTEEYDRLCRNLDEDPLHQYYEVLSWNELYEMFPIAPSTLCDEFGYSNAENDRVRPEFEFEWLTSGPLYERFGRKIFSFGPKRGFEPRSYYKEGE